MSWEGVKEKMAIELEVPREIFDVARELRTLESKHELAEGTCRCVPATRDGGEVLRRAEALFGITKFPEEAGFILPDGRLLNFSGRGGNRRPMERVELHSQVGEAFHPEDRQGWDWWNEPVPRFIDLGAVRIDLTGQDPGCRNEFNLQFQYGQPPTKEQAQTIIREFRRALRDCGNATYQLDVWDAPAGAILDVSPPGRGGRRRDCRRRWRTGSGSSPRRPIRRRERKGRPTATAAAARRPLKDQ